MLNSKSRWLYSKNIQLRLMHAHVLWACCGTGLQVRLFQEIRKSPDDAEYTLGTGKSAKAVGFDGAF
ncbi:predicted protein [Plenodomus lingam JN3]|uniref:Predicted protein n=1 Tax=Leptosphaeria maculans (strain JN3 / isolate v23.1.3 / race Av1-4-5-6-7-8) TaxID=985895 RepID=E5A1C0_LEPMJ|nr:predicted protein [Plenodomus lingam JN3]CBX97384.1 predicted protein [Plenodomus lingam JN3]